MYFKNNFDDNKPLSRKVTERMQQKELDKWIKKEKKEGD